MKTTVNVPDEIYRAARKRAFDRGETFRELYVRSLRREMASDGALSEPDPRPYWSRRDLVPGYAEAIQSGEFAGGTDSSRIVAEERESG